MIKRYILHLEFHWGYRPRISLKRMLRPGDRILNGDEMGTLKLCPECQDGLLHEPDWRAALKNLQSVRPTLAPDPGSWHRSPRAMDFNAPPSPPDAVFRFLELCETSLDYKQGEVITYDHCLWEVDEVMPKNWMRLKLLKEGVF